MTDAPESNVSKVICPVCSHSNRAGTLVCENCGSLITSSAPMRQATRDLKEQTEDPPATETKKIAEIVQDLLAGKDKDGAPEPKGGEYRAGMHLLLEVKDLGRTLHVPAEMLRQQLVIGRKDPITQQSPPIDLDDFSAYRMGVSRKHAAIQVIKEVLTVSDLGSANGTYINNRRLPMRQPQVILDGDLLRIGQIDIVVRFSTEDIAT